MKKYPVSLVAAMALLFSGFTIAYDEPKYNSNFLVSLFFKAQTLRVQAEEEIRKLDIEIKNNEATIQKAKQIIDLASQRTDANAKQAATIAREALIKAQEAKKKNEESRRQWEQRKIQADRSYATILNMMNYGSNKQIKGFVTSYTGRVDIFKANGDKETPEYGFLEPGDKIWTYDNSSAEIQMLDGRATVKIGPYSEFVMKEDTLQEQVVELLKGKVYMAVNKADDYVKEMKKNIEQYKKDIQTIKQWTNEQLDEYNKKINEEIYKYKKRLDLYLHSSPDCYSNEMKTKRSDRCITAVCGVRGTKFASEVKENNSMEVTVLEGIVDITIPELGKTVSLTTGYKAIINKDGTIKQEKADNVERWWEE